MFECKVMRFLLFFFFFALRIVPGRIVCFHWLLYKDQNTVILCKRKKVIIFLLPKIGQKNQQEQLASLFSVKKKSSTWLRLGFAPIQISPGFFTGISKKIKVHSLDEMAEK